MPSFAKSISGLLAMLSLTAPVAATFKLLVFNKKPNSETEIEIEDLSVNVSETTITPEQPRQELSSKPQSQSKNLSSSTESSTRSTDLNSLGSRGSGNSGVENSGVSDSSGEQMEEDENKGQDDAKEDNGVQTLPPTPKEPEPTTPTEPASEDSLPSSSNTTEEDTDDDEEEDGEGTQTEQQPSSSGGEENQEAQPEPTEQSAEKITSRIPNQTVKDILEDILPSI